MSTSKLDVDVEISQDESMGSQPSGSADTRGKNRKIRIVKCLEEKPYG